MILAPNENTVQSGEQSGGAQVNWSRRYGERHRLTRIADFPGGITAPQKIRLYYRHDHFVLQWWDPAAKKNLCDRVDGDLVSAIARARQIDERLVHFRSAGLGTRRLGHQELVQRFLADLDRRADAGAIDPATVRRYAAALEHYRAYCDQTDVRKAWPFAAGVDRDFRLGFAAFLANRRVTGNGNTKGNSRPMKGQSFVLDTVRTLFAWAADPERGNLLPDGFRNPFLRHGEASAVLKGDPLSEPDITISMALDLLAASDRLQLLLFAPMILFGLRAAEPCFLFHEYIQNGWLSVPSNTDLAYRTKGRRDKRLPLIDSLQPLWHVLHASGQAGVLYLRRRVVEGVEVAPLRDHSLPKLVAEFEHRCARVTVISGAERHKVRNAVMREAGAMTYDDVEQEFRRLSSKLCWPASATLKDLRHLFATSMSNAGMPEAYRRYLMGHSPGKSAIIAYTHLNQLAEHYANAVGRELAPLVEAVRKRVAELS